MPHSHLVQPILHKSTEPTLRDVLLRHSGVLPPLGQDLDMPFSEAMLREDCVRQLIDGRHHAVVLFGIACFGLVACHVLMGALKGCVANELLGSGSGLGAIRRARLGPHFWVTFGAEVSVESDDIHYREAVAAAETVLVCAPGPEDAIERVRRYVEPHGHTVRNVFSSATLTDCLLEMRAAELGKMPATDMDKIF